MACIKINSLDLGFVACARLGLGVQRVSTQHLPMIRGDLASYKAFVSAVTRIFATLITVPPIQLHHRMLLESLGLGTQNEAYLDR
jgi:hypothetical protein